MVLIVTVRPQSILLVVIGMPQDTFIGMDGLNVRLHLLIRTNRRIRMLGNSHDDGIWRGRQEGVCCIITVESQIPT